MAETKTTETKKAEPKPMDPTSMNIFEKLTHVQVELNAPKSLWNDFGQYNYRSAEQILEGLKPLLLKYHLTQFIADTIELVGDRYYIVATVTLYDFDKPSQAPIVATSRAREDLGLKGMHESQISGASSSFARKYALNGLYAIDDTKDPDDNSVTLKNPANEQRKPTTATKPQNAPQGSQGAPQQNTPPQTPKAPPKATGIPGDIQITFGKHNGQMLSEVFKSDRQYCEWMLTSDRISDAIKLAISNFITNDIA